MGGAASMEMVDDLVMSDVGFRCGSRYEASAARVDTSFWYQTIWNISNRTLLQRHKQPKVKSNKDRTRTISPPAACDPKTAI